MVGVDRLLNSVGKAIFIKYYYNFKNHSRDYCIMAFTEEYTDKAKSSRTGHAQTIFRNGLEKEALKIIISSNRLDENIIQTARDILKQEI